MPKLGKRRLAIDAYFVLCIPTEIAVWRNVTKHLIFDGPSWKSRLNRLNDLTKAIFFHTNAMIQGNHTSFNKAFLRINTHEIAHFKFN